MKGGLEQTVLFIHTHLWFIHPNRSTLNSVLPRWPFKISNQFRQLTSPTLGAKHCRITMETVYEDLAASFERWSGRWASCVCSSTALSMLYSLLKAAVDLFFFFSFVTVANKCPMVFPGWQRPSIIQPSAPPKDKTTMHKCSHDYF